MQVRVVAAGHEHLAHEHVGPVHGKCAAVDAGALGVVEVREPPPLHEFHRHDPPRRSRPDDARHHDQRVVGEVEAETVGHACLVAQVALGGQRARELLEQARQVEPPQPADAREQCDERRGAGDVGDHARLDAGPHHLDRERGARRQDGAGDGAVLLGECGAVHLRDRGGGDRRVVEGREQLLGLAAEVRADDGADVLRGRGGHVVAEVLELEDPFGREDVRADRHELAELDPRGAAALHEQAQPARHEAREPAALPGTGVARGHEATSRLRAGRCARAARRATTASTRDVRAVRRLRSAGRRGGRSRPRESRTAPHHRPPARP